MKNIICLALLVVVLPVMSFGEEQHKQQEGDTAQGVEALSQDLRDLLSQEMVALQDGMMSIIPAYASGNWDEIAVTAGKIKNSYIIKQRLSESQKKELHAVLPPEFIENDQKFHYFSGMLAHAAKNKKVELINFYFSEMNALCVECHSKYAVRRFPDLSAQKKTGKHTD